MTAYFEFYVSNPDLEKIEAIIRKYKDYPIDHLREMFKKVGEQLMEIK